MTVTQAAESLYMTYSKYGVSLSVLRHLIQSGVKNYGMSTEAAYHGLRLFLGHEYNEPEIFNVTEISEITGEDEQTTAQRISSLLTQGESVSMYFPHGL